MNPLYAKSLIFASMKLEFEDWKVVPYAEAWQRQTACFDALVRAKQVGEECINRIILCEHPHVYTLGRSGKAQNMLLSDEQLRRIGATLYHIDRGGDITYHGPGQQVCYPILNLEEFSLGLKEYVHLLEEAVIQVCATYGVEAGRVAKATGVWLDGDTPAARKICAIGVRSSHFVTMHGLALNVNTDLRYFSYIHPCGFIDKGVTSLQKELGYALNPDEVKERLCNALSGMLPSSAITRETETRNR
ncbi:MAG: lipoyl(octanoyl) transferase LipB [Bacteroides sp.]|nr:lipoyl(octanoyl) transferase LipB [Bacteroides sp.]